MTQKLNIDNGYSDTVDRRPAGNSGFAKKRVQWLIQHSTPHQLLCFIDSFVLRNPLLRKAAKRYRKPYDDSANIKLTEMKRTILDNITERLTAKPTSQRNEDLFFTDPHFLFFNFIADTHLAHLVLPDTQADASQNQKSQIFPRFTKTITFDY